MTRETKISLLVGLAFMLVIGILLSDHFRSTQELPKAVLTSFGPIVRSATDTPGTASQGISFAPPADTAPRESVPTHDELSPAASPVVPSSSADQRRSVAEAAAQPAPTNEIHGADAPARALSDVAGQNGEAVIPANIDGSSREAETPASPQAVNSPVASLAQREYQAEDGDTVSRMAAKFLGSNTRANRQAIIDANPSLRENPDRVIVGKTYIIPTPGGRDVVADAHDVASDSPSSRDALTKPAGYVYEVKEGDSLWLIANNELDDPSAVEAIKDLNAGVLKGENHDVVIPGMKLRLPAKPVADSGN